MAGRSHPGWGMFVRKIAVAWSVLFGVLLVASSLGVNGFGFGHPRDRQSGPESDPGTTSRVREAFGTLPLSFVENRGQVDPRVAYYVPGHDTAFYFTREGVTIALTGSTLSRASGPDGLRDVARQTGLPSLPDREGSPQRWAVKLDFVGANPEVRPVGQDPTPAVVSYFKGPREAWKTGLPTYASVVYPNLWPGIDLVYTGTATRLKYTFLVHPGADPDRIELACRGATAVTLTDGGELDVSTPLGGFRDAKPYAYQEMEGRRVGVGATYALSPDAAGAHGYGFRLGSYDRARLLVLDPAILVYAGYIGGSSFDRGSGIAVDSAGNAYVTGFTTSTEATFPETVGPDLTYNGGDDDAFVAKVNAAGTALLYAGYIGGTGRDEAFGIAVDIAGNAYVTGFTTSTEATFPETVGPDLTYNGNLDAFVAKVNAAGTALLYAGYIGGSADEGGYGIAVDVAGNAYVTGFTSSSEATFPVTVGPDLTFNGAFNAFVAKVNAAGTALVYAGYIGGSGGDEGFGIAVDSAGNAYVTGLAQSSEATFPVTVGPDLTFNGNGDAFVAKVNAAGTALVYAGYIGGSSFEEAFGIAVDVAGNAYVAGTTASSEATFPVTVGPDTTYNGGANVFGADAFVAEVNAAGTALVYAGYVGGSGVDQALGIAVDVAGNAYVTGVTDSSETTFPVTVGPDLTYNGGSDAFVAKVNAGGTALVYAGYVGGASGELGFGIAVDVEGNAYVTGQTSSSEATFPETVGPDLTYNGNGDAFIAKIAELAPPATLTLSPATDTNPVGTSHTVTATVEDAFGNPVPDVVVRFTVTGSVSAQGPCTTNSNGQCDFTYQGPDLPGADVITAFGDTDGDGTQDAGEPTGAAAKIWVLPVTTPLCEIIITDGGWIIANNGDKANFGGNAKSSESGATSGQQQYRDRGPAQPMRVQSINVLAIVCDGTSQASIYGQATIDGSGSFFYRIKVKDVAEPGAGQDTYWIILETGYNSGEHTLGGGNVQIHRG